MTELEDEIVSFQPRGGEDWRDPFPAYRRLRDDDPVHYAEWGDFWVLSRFADVFTAARDPGRFSSASGLTYRYGEREEIGMDVSPIVMMDPPEHTAFRRLVSKGFTPRQVAEIEDDVRSFVVARLDAIEGEGEVDIVAELFKPLPSFVVAHYLGVPVADRELFDRWTDAIVAANAAGAALNAAEAVAELIAYFAARIAQCRDQPGDDMISALLQAGLEDEAELLGVLGFAFTMVTGGNDTATGLLGGAAVMLTDHPSQRGVLLAEPGTIPTAVDEFLRLTSPVQNLARTTTEPVVIGDVEIPQGKKVMLLYAAANRDEREFGPTAEDCDVTRNIARMVAFSHGAHHCLGAAAARLEARVVLEEMLARCPDFAVDSGAATFAPGAFVRRHATLPFSWNGLR